MKIIREGDRGVALAPKMGPVPVVYRYRDLTLDSGVTVPSVLVGVHEGTDEILIIPSQSTARIKEEREDGKEEVLEARVPRELEDVLALLADHFRVSTRKFAPALIRFYLHVATEQPALARRLARLSQESLAQGRLAGRIKVRCESRLIAQLDRVVAELGQVSQSDLVRGVIMAAKEDVLDGRAKNRSLQLEAVAAAV